MSKRLNHTWNKTGKFESVCTRCDCSRTKEGVKYGSQWKSVFYYTRSKMTFGLQKPECIDWTDDSLD